MTAVDSRAGKEAIFLKYRRIFTIVIDSFGIGAMEDARDYSDEGADTLGHIDDHMPVFRIPNLMSLGLGKLHPVAHGPVPEKISGYYTRMHEASTGKDTMTGHWELMGLLITQPFLTFTDTGFPPELIQKLESETGHKVIGNRAASGTAILDELGEEHLKTGAMIVYTSADSVLQIAASEETFGLEELYRCCEIARKLTMKPEWKVGRVIARPFVGTHKGAFVRTANRHDYALKPFGPTVLNGLKDAGFDVISIGKINDIFAGEGITQAFRSKSSVHGMEQTIEQLERDFCGLCFVNLVDFDALWGHRRDPKGYGHELERFDEKLGIVLSKLRADDLLMITADHGNDPTFKGTDHTREMVPLLLYSPSMTGSGRLEDTKSFGAAGRLIANNFRIPMPEGAVGDFSDPLN